MTITITLLSNNIVLVIVTLNFHYVHKGCEYTLSSHYSVFPLILYNNNIIAAQRTQLVLILIDGCDIIAAQRSQTGTNYHWWVWSKVLGSPARACAARDTVLFVSTKIARSQYLARHLSDS